jgi:glycosyltransferase involved in cell wall biosynthesis
MQDYIAETLESILTQTHNNWEAIIIDDGSTDKSGNIALEYCQKDQRFRYIYQENAGIAGARKRGIESSRGEFIQFLDADDVILTDRLDKMINQYEDSGSWEILYSNFIIGDHTNIYEFISLPSKPASIGRNITYIDFYKDWTEKFIFIPACIMFRREHFSDLEFDTTYTRAEDFDLYLNLTSRGYSFRNINIANVIYRNNPFGLSKDRARTHESIMKVLFKWRNESTGCYRYFVLRTSRIEASDILTGLLRKSVPILNIKNLRVNQMERIVMTLVTGIMFISLIMRLLYKKIRYAFVAKDGILKSLN